MALKRSKKSASSKTHSIRSHGFRHIGNSFTVALAGAGGTGSIMLTHLCRIHRAFTSLGGKPFNIVVYDPDVVTESNLCRQCFCEADLGMNKAVVLAQRARAFFDIPVEARAEAHTTRTESAWDEFDHKLIVSCTDSLAYRQSLKIDSDVYWLDLGNTLDSGQVVLGGCGLPTIADITPGFAELKEQPDMPSCSVAESLAKQDLMINSIVANYGAQIIWRLLRHGSIEHHGYYINLKTGFTRPIACPLIEIKKSKHSKRTNA